MSVKINYGPTQEVWIFQKKGTVYELRSRHMYVYLERTVPSSLRSVSYRNQLHRTYSKRMCLIYSGFLDCGTLGI